MDFLEKLNYLMDKNHLNKSTLSKACNIPYTTIDGWYKKGYEGLKLTTLRKLAEFFGTSLDYWASEDNELTAGKSESANKAEWLHSTRNLQSKEVPRTNVLRLAGRDGSYRERVLSDQQMAALEAILDQMPDVPDDL